jgi:hypothetical protein
MSEELEGEPSASRALSFLHLRVAVEMGDEHGEAETARGQPGNDRGLGLRADQNVEPVQGNRAAEHSRGGVTAGRPERDARTRSASAG